MADVLSQPRPERLVAHLPADGATGVRVVVEREGELVDARLDGAHLVGVGALVLRHRHRVAAVPVSEDAPLRNDVPDELEPRVHRDATGGAPEARGLDGAKIEEVDLLTAGPGD